jgi:hypothetical protein
MKRYIRNTTSHREYFLPGGSDLCKIQYDYPYVYCKVYNIFKGVSEEYKADKRHPHWQKHVEIFETLAWEKYRTAELIKAALERRNAHRQGN